jgi:hypothetical protein
MPELKETLIMAEDKDVLGYDEFYEDKREGENLEADSFGDNQETDSFGERLAPDERVESDSSTEVEDEDKQDGPIDSMTDKAREFGRDIKDKF